MRLWARVVALAIVAAACASEVPAEQARPAIDTTTLATTTSTAVATTTTTATTTTSTTSTVADTTTTEPARIGQPPPDWLGTVELALRPGEDNAVAQPTPAELVDRRLWTEDTLTPPPGDQFVSTVITPPPPDVVARSTWREECPVALDELTYAQVSFVGFDGLFHTGEFILHSDFAEQVVNIFAELHAMRFPIEEMTVTTQEAVDAHPTGDSNNTSSFVCRQAVASGRWSRHAWGGAIDINPFHNPYRRGDLIIPALASAYLDREQERPGMITPEVAALFADIGWGWGGNWQSLDDWMHFSDTGN